MVNTEYSQRKEFCYGNYHLLCRQGKNLEAIELIDTLEEISEESGWSYHLVNRKVKS